MTFKESPCCCAELTWLLAKYRLRAQLRVWPMGPGFVEKERNPIRNPTLGLQWASEDEGSRCFAEGPEECVFMPCVKLHSWTKCKWEELEDGEGDYMWVWGMGLCTVHAGCCPNSGQGEGEVAPAQRCLLYAKSNGACQGPGAGQMHQEGAGLVALSTIPELSPLTRLAAWQSWNKVVLKVRDLQDPHAHRKAVISWHWFKGT